MFAGNGLFDDTLHLMEIKGALLTLPAGQPYDMGERGVITRKDTAMSFVNFMVANGYQLESATDDSAVFLKDERRYVFFAEDFALAWRVYRQNSAYKSSLEVGTDPGVVPPLNYLT